MEELVDKELYNELRSVFSAAVKEYINCGNRKENNLLFYPKALVWGSKYSRWQVDKTFLLLLKNYIYYFNKNNANQYLTYDDDKKDVIIVTKETIGKFNNVCHVDEVCSVLRKLVEIGIELYYSNGGYPDNMENMEMNYLYGMMVATSAILELNFKHVSYSIPYKESDAYKHLNQLTTDQLIVLRAYCESMYETDDSKLNNNVHRVIDTVDEVLEERKKTPEKKSFFSRTRNDK